jgi:pyruvate dehydrogenase E1 component beta subunit
MVEKTFSEAIAEAIIEEMNKDQDIVVIGVEVGTARGGIGKVMAKVSEKISSDRIIDTPLAESLVAGAAVGAAMVGMRPIAELLSADYIPLASDSIVNTAARMRYSSGGKLQIPIVYRIAFGSVGLVDMWESSNMEAWLVHTPGLKVVMPSTPFDAKGLLKTSIKDNNPVIFFEHKSLYNEVGDVPDEEYYIPIGKADIKREGEDVTIIANGMTVKHSIEAAKKLSEEEISVEVVDLRTLSPLDKEAIINSARKTGRVIVTHEDTKTGGIGAEIAAIILEESHNILEAPIKRVTAPDTPLPWSPPLREYYLPDSKSIIDEVKKFF